MRDVFGAGACQVADMSSLLARLSQPTPLIGARPSSCYTDSMLSRLIDHPMSGVVVVFLIGIIGACSVSMRDSMGWDEAMHLAAPAAHISQALGEGEVREAVNVVLSCERYPPLTPALHGFVGWVLGSDELLMRQTQRWFWALGLLGIFLLVRAACRPDEHDEPSPGARGAPWMALALLAMSPMALAFGGTLFLESSFVAWGTLAVAAWIVRSRKDSLLWDVGTGVLLAACLFTKWNYGLLLGAALAVDLTLEGIARRDNLRPYLFSVLRLGLPSFLACLWWFGLPLPAGLETAASHRAAFISFLGGNIGLQETPAADRWVHWTLSLVPSPRVLLWVVLAAGLMLFQLRNRAIRILVLVLVLGGVPVWIHNFQLERFLLPGAPFLFALAAIGVSGFLARLGSPGAFMGVALLGLGLVVPVADSMAMLHAVGRARPEKRAEQEAILAAMRSLAPGRSLPTNGIERASHDRLIELLDIAFRSGERIAWLGHSQAFPPMAWAMGLKDLRPDDPRARDLIRDPHGRIITTDNQAPPWSSAELERWAKDFDVILTSDPTTIKGGARQGFDPLRNHLRVNGEWLEQVVGSTEVQLPGGRTREVTLSAFRRR